MGPSVDNHLLEDVFIYDDGSRWELGKIELPVRGERRRSLALLVVPRLGPSGDGVNRAGPMPISIALAAPLGAAHAICNASTWSRIGRGYWTTRARSIAPHGRSTAGAIDDDSTSWKMPTTPSASRTIGRRGPRRQLRMGALNGQPGAGRPHSGCREDALGCAPAASFLMKAATGSNREEVTLAATSADVIHCTSEILSGSRDTPSPLR